MTKAIEKRIGFYLTEWQIRTLRKLTRRTGLKQSELVRRALDKLFAEYGEGPEKQGEKK